MKKILSLVLVVVMLLSAVPMTWAAEQDIGTADKPKHFASLVMNDSIAINFKVTKAWLEQNGFTKAEFYMDGELVHTITEPTDDSGLALFTFDKLNPAQMGEKVTIKYCAGDSVLAEKSYSVLDYCNLVLSDETESSLLKTALVDMLYYGAASQAYLIEQGDTTVSTTPVTDSLAEEYQALRTTTELTLTDKKATRGSQSTVKWNTAGLNLGTSVKLRFKFTAASTEGIYLKVTCGANEWKIENFEANGDGTYTVYFSGLNPAQLRKLFEAQFFDASDTAVSKKLIYSVESYAADNDGDSEELKALTAALLHYGDSVYNWVNTYQVGSDKTYIEAEDVDLFTAADSTLNYFAPVTVVDDAIQFGVDYSYQNYTTVGDTTKPAHLSFKVNASAEGTYYIWARVKKFDADTPDHFCYIDGISKRADGADYSEITGWQYNPWRNITGEYAWVKIATCEWKEGQTYSVRLRARKYIAVIDQFLVTTSTETPHDHVYSDEWSTDETNHWHACTTTGCTEVSDLAAHVYDNDADSTCNTCEYTRHIHTFSDAWTTDDTHHWHTATCEHTDLVSDKAEHDYGTTGVCACGKVDFYVGSSSLTYIEAEDVDLFTGMDSTLNTGVPNVVVISDNNYALNGKVAQWGTTGSHTTKTAAGDTVEDKPAHISFEVKPSEGGTYYIWARLCNTSSASNCFSYIDGKNGVESGWRYQDLGSSKNSDANGETFVWVKLATCTWEADGTYVVRLRHRQGGCIFDQFMVTSDENYKTTWPTT